MSYPLSGLLGPRVIRQTDFLGLPGGPVIDGIPLAGAQKAGAGTSVFDFMADQAHGLYELKTDATNEGQIVLLSSSDHLWIDSTKKPIIEFRAKVKFSAPTGLPNAGDKIVLGVGSNYSADPDTVAKSAWFMLKGASDLNLYVEADDGTTDSNDIDTGFDVVSDTFYKFRIDMTDLSSIAFSVDGALLKTLSAPAMTGNLQPYILLSRSAGAAIEQIVLDWMYISYER